MAHLDEAAFLHWNGLLHKAKNLCFWYEMA